MPATKAKPTQIPPRGSVTPMVDRLLSIADFCQEAGISEVYFHKLKNEGSIKTTKLGRLTKIDGREFLRWRDSLRAGA